MKRDSQSWDSVLQRLRDGDPQAADQIVHEFAPAVQGMVRERLPKILRSKFDSIDFVQTVLKSLVLDPPELKSPDQLRNYVSGMVRNKVRQRYRQWTRFQKYDLSREQPISWRSEPCQPNLHSPASHLEDQEVWDQLVADLPPAHVQVLAMKRDGCTYAQITAATRISERTARRILEQARQRLLRGISA